MFIFIVAYGASIGPVTWLYVPEIISPTAIPFVVALNWIGCEIVVLLFLIVRESLLHGNPSMEYLAFSVLCLVGVLLSSKFMMETKGKTEK